MAGTFAVAITTEGERASTTAGTAQTAALTADETLTVNNVSIFLTNGMSQAQVVNRINEFTSQTAVVADVDSGSTRLYTKDFGSAASLTVVSNIAARATNSGFGTASVTDVGIDVIGTIDGTSYTGSGNILTATSGSAKGIAVQFAADTGANASKTVAAGAQGNVTVNHANQY